MARRVIESPKGMESPEQLEDRSELSLLYPDARAVNDNPISTQSERDEKAQQSRDRSVRSLRKWGAVIGLYVTLPYVVGTVVIQQVIMGIPNIAPGDIGGAMFIVFMSFFTALGTITVAFLSLRKAASYFYARALKSIPVLTTILGSVAALSPVAFKIGDTVSHDIAGYLAVLLTLFAIGAISAFISTFIWTTKWPVTAKFVGLGGVVAIALAVMLFV